MKCWHCQNNVIWGGDHTFEDYGLEGDGIVTNLHCSVCNAQYLIYLGEEDACPSKNVKFVASDFFNSLPIRIQNALRSSSDFVKNWEEKDEDGKIYHPVGYEIINFSTASEYEAMKFLQKNINDNCSQLYRLRNCGMKSIQILKDFLKKRRN